MGNRRTQENRFIGRKLKVVTLTENSFKIQIKAVFVSILFKFKKRYAALNEISYDNNFLTGIILLKWKLIRGSNSEIRKTCFAPKRPDRLRGPHRLLFNGYQGIFSGGKATRAEADHSHPTNSTL